MLKIRFIFFSVFLICTGCFQDLKPVQFGVQDDVNKASIIRANQLSSLRKSLSYKMLAENLKSDLSSFSSNAYAVSRIKNELAAINSFQLLDIEEAIRLDQELLQAQSPSSDTIGDFVPKHNVASQSILADITYKNEFLSISSSELKERATQRLKTNRKLVSGKYDQSSNYTLSFLKDHLTTVQEDISSTVENSEERLRILSRLIRAEYELAKMDSQYKLTSYTYFTNGQLPSNRVDFAEINFLSLADYFSLVYKQTGNVQFAEYALETVYLPYINLRKASNRWRYNTLINDYISTLIEADYKRHQYEDMIYYISLNKSRMLLEERLLVSQQNKQGNNIANNMGDIELNSSGLPDKQAFKRKLKGIDGFLDFYVDGHFSRERMATAEMLDRSTMPLSTRDFGLETSDDSVEVFIDSGVFLTSIQHGKVTGVEKISGRELRTLKKELSSSLNTIAKRSDQGQRSNVLQHLAKKLAIPRQLTLSPDKWIARHPLNFHLGAESIRSVNLFTEAKDQRIDTIKLLGFFNPTLDLSGAEQEADAIVSKVPNAQIYKREAAQLTQLNKEKDANIIHLSMHGGFNSNDPKNSKLYFAGAKRGMATNDPNALYAKDMGQYAVLQDRQLIFAAACETGKISADQNNENELMGILRPLTANRNKNIILSLWKVDDQATKDFVAWFYQDLMHSHRVSTAFLSAQAKIRDKYPNPYYWAAFYLSQAN